MSSSPGVELSCNDSPLAIAGAIVTFATLVYALVVSALLRIQQLSRANDRFMALLEECIRLASSNNESKEIVTSIESILQEDSNSQELLKRFEITITSASEKLQALSLILSPHSALMTLLFAQKSFNAIADFFISQHSPLYFLRSTFTWTFFNLKSSLKARRDLEKGEQKLLELRQSSAELRSMARELRARAADRQRLDQNHMLITLLERVKCIEAYCRNAGSSGIAPQAENPNTRPSTGQLTAEDNLRSALMRPRRQGTGLVSIFSEDVQATSSDEQKELHNRGPLLEGVIQTRGEE